MTFTKGHQYFCWDDIYFLYCITFSWQLIKTLEVKKIWYEEIKINSKGAMYCYSWELFSYKNRYFQQCSKIWDHLKKYPTSRVYKFRWFVDFWLISIRFIIKIILNLSVCLLILKSILRNLSTVFSFLFLFNFPMVTICELYLTA